MAGVSRRAEGLRAGLQLLGLSLKSVAFDARQDRRGRRHLDRARVPDLPRLQDELRGFADYVNKLVSRVRLLYDGLVQVFTQGGSHWRRAERAEQVRERGIKRFVINVYALFARLCVFFEGVADGFAAAWVKVGPLRVGDVHCAQDVVLAFFGIFAGADETVTNTSTNSWRLWGDRRRWHLFVLNVRHACWWFARLIGDHLTLTKYALYTYAARTSC